MVSRTQIGAMCCYNVAEIDVGQIKLKFQSASGLISDSKVFYSNFIACNDPNVKGERDDKKAVIIEFRSVIL